MKEVESGEYKGFRWWIMQKVWSNGIIPGWFMAPIEWYLCYIEIDGTPEEIPDDATEYKHPLIEGIWCNFDEFEFLDVHGGVTFVVTDGKRTIVGWDYSHCDDWEQPSVDKLKEEIKKACEQLEKEGYHGIHLD